MALKIYLVGHPGSQHIVPASKYLTAKYLPGFEVIYLNHTGPIEYWSDFLVAFLSNLTDERIIFSLDDYLISDFINPSAYQKAVSYMGAEVVCVKLCRSTQEEHKEYPVTTQYCIWDRKYLIWLLQQIKNPWEFEVTGSKIHYSGKKVVLLETCIFYDTHSALSGRWAGMNLSGLKESDILFMRETGILPTKLPSQNEPEPSNEKIVVLGGSGSLGQALIARLISMGHKNIVSVSRNESAAVALKEKYPSVQIMIGDISDAWTVRAAMDGAKEIYLCAALKHVGLAEQQVNTCILTNIVGVMNVVNESFSTKPKVLMFISSDKAAQGTGVYGCTKKIAERLMAEAEKINPDTKYRVVRYGNVWASQGSIATKWKPKMEKGEEIIITDPEATRFFWPMEEAIDLIFDCIATAKDSSPSVPQMKAVAMGTVLEACMEVWGKSPVKVIGLQAGENKHETTDGVVFSDTCEQFSKEEFKQKFLLSGPVSGAPTPPLDREIKEFKQSTPPPAHPKISAVLITRKAEYPKLVLERLEAGNFFDEILIMEECPSVYHRYLAAKQARNEIVYFQDDDCMVNHQVLFKSYNGKITNAMTKEFIAKYKDTGCTLIGWGAFFPKSMLGVFDKYIAKFGVDIHLHREADRIFTFLNSPWNVIQMPHEDLDQTPDRMGYQENHYTSMAEALEKAKTLAIQEAFQ